MSKRSRGWCLTLNNYNEKSVEYLKKWFEENCEYACIGREVGESGTKHLQMCCEFKHMKSFDWMKKTFKKSHIEPRRGTKSEASDYCKKDGDYLEIGSLKNDAGKRTDLCTVRDAVNDGKSMREICDMTTSYQALRYAETLRKYKMGARNWKPTVYWYWGGTGLGKTRSAMEESDACDRWVSMESMKWFDGYDGHSDVIFDDFRPEQCNFSFLLRLLDRYELRVESKGGSTQFLAKRIWITCPVSPEEGFKRKETDGNLKQLLRRIDVIKEFREGTYVEPLEDCDKHCYIGHDEDLS